MKKYFFKITTIFLLVGLITSCDEKQVVYDGEPAVALFASDFAQLNVLEGTNGTAQVVVNVSNLSTSDRKIVVSVDEEGTTASPSQYNIEASSLFIPANSYTGYIKVSSTFTSLPEVGSVILVLNLVEVGDSSVHIDTVESTYTLTIKKSCPFDAATIGVNFTGTSSVNGDLITTFIPEMVQSTTNPNLFTLNTLWGLNFIGDITGSPSYNGKFVYPGTILINDDLTLTVTGIGDSRTPGGTGAYDPCTNTFKYFLNQSLFEDPFTVSVVLTPN